MLVTPGTEKTAAKFASACEFYNAATPATLLKSWRVFPYAPPRVRKESLECLLPTRVTQEKLFLFLRGGGVTGPIRTPQPPARVCVRDLRPWFASVSQVRTGARIMRVARWFSSRKNTVRVNSAPRPAVSTPCISQRMGAGYILHGILADRTSRPAFLR